MADGPAAGSFTQPLDELVTNLVSATMLEHNNVEHSTYSTGDHMQGDGDDVQGAARAPITAAVEAMAGHLSP